MIDQKTEEPQAEPSPAADNDNAHTCCLHVAGGPFGLGNNPQQPSIIGRTSVCCFCGRATVKYMGVIEQGHGRHVTYLIPEQRAAQLLVPSGVDPRRLRS